VTRFKKRNFGTVKRIREKEGRSKDVNLNSASGGECNRDKKITDVTKALDRYSDLGSASKKARHV